LVETVRFHDKYVRSDRTRPAYISIETQFTYHGGSKGKDFDFENKQCRGKTPEQLLRERGITLASKEECEAHDKQYARYCELAVQIGLQVTSVGIGKGEDREHGTKNLGVNGQPSILVVDVEDDRDEDDSNMHDCEIRHDYLPYKLYEIRDRVRDNKVVDLENEDFEEEESRYIEAPVHPWINCFDLRRHARFEVHVNDLIEYVYDPNLDEKLVIDGEVKELIGLLSRSQDSKFKDVVAGKTGGTTVLLAGPPGVGKTLTAEIFSEAVEKPLYRVQCSQLGTDPDELEQKLLKVFRRAARWKAIILLDESDVYVAKRGDCLAKNAIVGVFLRVLEYQESVMFMTTNLPESVDDAIASRCIARIDYDIPKPEDLNKIWDILSANAGMELDWTVRSQITNEFPHLSGRDVKNILKLIAARNQPIDLASVKQAAKFHPNRGNWREQEWK
jgi:DNA polymerase III delta prime subunit